MTAHDYAILFSYSLFFSCMQEHWPPREVDETPESIHRDTYETRPNETLFDRELTMRALARIHERYAPLSKEVFEQTEKVTKRWSMETGKEDRIRLRELQAELKKYDAVLKRLWEIKDERFAVTHLDTSFTFRSLPGGYALIPKYNPDARSEEVVGGRLMTYEELFERFGRSVPFEHPVPKHIQEQREREWAAEAAAANAAAEALREEYYRDLLGIPHNYDDSGRTGRGNGK